MSGAAVDDTPADADTLRRLRWRCRRGLLENDLFVERFFERHGDRLTNGMVRGLLALMELSDNDLLDLVLGRTRLSGPADTPEARQVLEALRVPGGRGPTAP